MDVLGGLQENSARWGRLALPFLFLAYTAEAVGGLLQYSHGWALVVGAVGIAVFCLCYVLLVYDVIAMPTPRFAGIVGVMALLCILELDLARLDALVLWIFLLAPLIGRYKLRSRPVIAGAVIGSFLVGVSVPYLNPSGGVSAPLSMSLSILLASLVVLAFAQLIRANAMLVETRDEVKRLERDRERLRIARDLHDVLGHSLTSLAVKAELAAKLIDRDPARSREEIEAVEAIARQALADVRVTVAGYRTRSLDVELDACRSLLSSAGVAVEIRFDPAEPSPAVAEAFGWVLREAVTNIVRHAGAQRCVIEVSPMAICVSDDGCGGEAQLGSGLSGLAERAELIGGIFRVGPVVPQGWEVRLEVAGVA